MADNYGQAAPPTQPTTFKLKIKLGGGGGASSTVESSSSSLRAPPAAVPPPVTAAGPDTSMNVDQEDELADDDSDNGEEARDAAAGEDFRDGKEIDRQSHPTSASSASARTGATAPSTTTAASAVQPYDPMYYDVSRENYQPDTGEAYDGESSSGSGSKRKTKKAPVGSFSLGTSGSPLAPAPQSLPPASAAPPSRGASIGGPGRNWRKGLKGYQRPEGSAAGDTSYLEGSPLATHEPGNVSTSLAHGGGSPSRGSTPVGPYSPASLAGARFAGTQSLASTSYAPSSRRKRPANQALSEDVLAAAAGLAGMGGRIDDDDDEEKEEFLGSRSSTGKGSQRAAAAAANAAVTSASQANEKWQNGLPGGNEQSRATAAMANAVNRMFPVGPLPKTGTAFLTPAPLDKKTPKVRSWKKAKREIIGPSGAPFYVSVWLGDDESPYENFLVSHPRGNNAIAPRPALPAAVSLSASASGNGGDDGSGAEGPSMRSSPAVSSTGPPPLAPAIGKGSSKGGGGGAAGSLPANARFYPDGRRMPGPAPGYKKKKKVAPQLAAAASPLVLNPSIAGAADAPVSLAAAQAAIAASNTPAPPPPSMAIPSPQHAAYASPYYSPSGTSQQQASSPRGGMSFGVMPPI